MQAPPLVDPDQPLFDDYVIRLPFPMARRIENGSLVFWHTPQGLTFWISASERGMFGDPLEGWRKARSSQAEEECTERVGDLVRYGYRLSEGSDDNRQSAFYGFVAEATTEFLLAGYFDYPDAIDAVMRTWRSIRRRPAE